MVIKIGAIIIKNLKIRGHHWILTLCQCLIPLALFLSLAIIRAKTDGLEKIYIKDPTYSTQYSSERLYNDKFNHETKIYYCPNNVFTSELMYQVQFKFSLNIEAIKGFQDEADMLAHIEYNENSIMAIVFKNLTMDEMPNNLQYSIRPYEKFVDWETDLLFKAMQTYIPDSGSETYINRGFLALQMAVESSFIEMVTNKSLPVSILMEEFPYPPHLESSGAKDMFEYVLPLITAISFTLLCPLMLTRVIEDKISGMKQLIKVMGVKSWMIWITWFLDAFVWNLISIIFITIILKVTVTQVTPPIEHCSGTVLFVFLSLYSSAVIAFCFALSSFLNKPTHLMTLTMLVWILSYLIPECLIGPGMAWYKKIVLIFPNAGMIFGYKVISEYESREIGVDWTNIFAPASGGNEEITMGIIFIIFIVQTIVYGILTFYFDNIFPGNYGIPSPWHFPATDIWNIRTKKVLITTDNSRSNSYVEFCDLPIGISVRNLSKSFGNHTAVDNLSIDIYKQQITVLLGKNGAGKTTTLNMITGMLNPTTGNILISNDAAYNIFQNVVSFCPQHNLQFSALTVIEHLIFFAMLKGSSRNYALKEATIILDLMNLTSKKDSLVSHLSGGMRRKLSLGIAVIGSTNVIILDEPTSGLDPESRRDIWDIIIFLRGARTIIITTHLMEEAEVLGDRIAIMDNGSLICYGTPLFLREKFGAGYYLTVNLNNGEKKDEVISTVRKASRDCTIETTNEDQIKIFLPNRAKTEVNRTLQILENKENVSSVNNIRLTATTLEEIFLRANTIVGKDIKPIQKSVSATCSTKGKTIKKRSQLIILFLKWASLTRWKLHISQIIITLLILILTLFLGESNRTTSAWSNPLPFNLEIYGVTKAYIGRTRLDVFEDVSQYYFDLIKEQSGQPREVTNVIGAIIEEGSNNIEYYKQHMVVAADLDRINGENMIKALYSNNAIHGAPISLNLLTNALLKSLMNDTYSITAENNPLPNPAQHSLGHSSTMQVLMIWYILFPLGVLLMCGLYLVVPQIERSSKLKLLQLMGGVSNWLYWFTCYIWDLTMYLISISFIISVTYLLNSFLNISRIFTDNEIGALYVILISFGITMLPYSYLYSYQRTAVSGYGLFLIVSLFTSNLMAVAMFYLEFSDDDVLKDIGKNLNFIFVLFPPYGLKYTVMKLVRKAVWNYNWNIKSLEHKQAVCASNYNPCCDVGENAQCMDYRSYFKSDDSLFSNISELIASAVIYFIILFLLENNFFVKFYRNLKCLLRPKLQSKNNAMDSEQPLLECFLKANDISKKIGSKQIIKNLNFTVNSGKSLGLLGVNGAGKTTTFRLLTGEEMIDEGDVNMTLAKTKSLSISRDKLEFLEKVGYCPQFDGISELTTGRTLLRLFAKLRGIQQVEYEVDIFLNVFGLNECADQLCSKYSGGNKRKLCTATSLIGALPLIILDEPTTGVDPISRRKLWNAISTFRNNDSAIILSTHSMEECEVLCENIAIMNDGAIVADGTINKLKEKFKEDFTVTLKLRTSLSICTFQENENNIKDGVWESNEIKKLKIEFGQIFTQNVLVDQHPSLLRYQIKDESKRLSELFKNVEDLQVNNPVIVDYDISEITLEQLFLDFTKQDTK